MLNLLLKQYATTEISNFIVGRNSAQEGVQILKKNRART